MSSDSRIESGIAMVKNPAGISSPHRAVPGDPSQPAHYQAFDDEYASQQIKKSLNKGLIKEGSNSVNVQDLRLKLYQGCYFFYCYILLFFTVVETFDFAILIITVLAAAGQEGGIDAIIYLLLIIKSAYNVIQFYTMYQGIIEKSLRRVEKAMRMMRFYMMVVIPHITAAIAIHSDVETRGKLYAFFVFTTVVIEVLFYFMFYFGATKVHQILIQVEDIKIKSSALNP